MNRLLGLVLQMFEPRRNSHGDESSKKTVFSHVLRIVSGEGVCYPSSGSMYAFFRKNWEWMLFGGVLLVSLGIRLSLVSGSSTFLLTHLLPDDAYYYFQLGRQAASGHGSTFDGVHLTNGYHPLWMWVNTAAFYVIHATSSEAPIRFLLCLTSLLDVAIGCGVYFLLRRASMARVWAILGMALYLLNPWTIANSVNGMESTLANAFLCATLCLGVVFLQAQSFHRRWLVLLSFSAVLTIFSRIDYALYIAVLGMVIFFLDHHRWSRSWYVAAFLPGGALLAVWAAASMHVFGAIIPQSGFAFSEVNRALFFYKERSWFTVVAWCFYQWARSLFLAAQTSGVSVGLWVILGVYLISLIVRRIRRIHISPVMWLVGSMVVAFIGYTFLQGAVRWSGREWYFTLGTFLFPLSSCFLISRLPMHRLKVRVFLVALLILSVGSFLLTNPLSGARYIHQQEILDAAYFLRDHLPHDTRIGMFNAGVLGFYAQQQVVNLDGVVNTSAYRALHQHAMKDYLKKEGIQYVLDYQIAIDYRYAPFWGVADRSFLKQDHQFSSESSYHQSGLFLYRVAD